VTNVFDHVTLLTAIVRDHTRDDLMVMRLLCQVVGWLVAGEHTSNEVIAREYTSLSVESLLVHEIFSKRCSGAMYRVAPN
jgi:hypothetical protein